MSKYGAICSSYSFLVKKREQILIHMDFQRNCINKERIILDCRKQYNRSGLWCRCINIIDNADTTTVFVHNVNGCGIISFIHITYLLSSYLFHCLFSRAHITRASCTEKFILSVHLLPLARTRINTQNSNNNICLQ